ncbi:MAG: superoxide dismutase [bacterium]|nr:superoxide dismutase [bacterium]
MKTARFLFLSLALAALSSTVALAHCQIPCGIYDDEARFVEMLEHVKTIEKGLNQIVSLGSEKKPDHNQVVRWVGNKDEHADKLAHIVTYYFMAQRVKLPATGADEKARARYAAQLAQLHKILVHSMKAKQTTDLEHVKTLRASIETFHESYFAK